VKVLVIGAGVAGLCCALELANAGASVEVIDRGARLGAESCSWFAGGMLAPWCESESAEPLVVSLGTRALEWWRAREVGLVQNGSLVLAQHRDANELMRFARRTEEHQSLSESEVATLEPDLGGRFSRGLFFPQEAHINPRIALGKLIESLAQLGVSIHYNRDSAEYAHDAEHIVDCRGLSARDSLSDLRGVKGEMLLIRSSEFSVDRPIRLLHPRIPLYIVPRGNGLFMIGATMIESDDRKRITARSMIELLQGAYALHPILGEAEVVETGCDVRPAFPDNLPRIRRRGMTTYVNGFYRHGFLLAPGLAEWTKEVVLNDAYYPEVMDEHPMQREAR
jgi:glycine oxidase